MASARGTWTCWKQDGNSCDLNVLYASVVVRVEDRLREDEGGRRRESGQEQLRPSAGEMTGSGLRLQGRGEKRSSSQYNLKSRFDGLLWGCERKDKIDDDL